MFYLSSYILLFFTGFVYYYYGENCGVYKSAISFLNLFSVFSILSSTNKIFSKFGSLKIFCYTINILYLLQIILLWGIEEYKKNYDLTDLVYLISLFILGDINFISKSNLFRELQFSLEKTDYTIQKKNNIINGIQSYLIVLDLNNFSIICSNSLYEFAKIIKVNEKFNPNYFLRENVINKQDLSDSIKELRSLEIFPFLLKLSGLEENKELHAKNEEKVNYMLLQLFK
jgi:hypothetical protein